MFSLGEIRRRKMFQVAAAYAVVAWLIVEIITTVEEPLNLPHWSDTFVIVLLALGFPLLLTVSWFFNVTQEGLVRDTGGTAKKSRTRFRFEWVLLGVVLVAVGWLLYRTEFGGQALPYEKPSEAAAEAAPLQSLAVLPFEILNSGTADEEFAGGLHEEILSRLAMLSGLRLTSRTSVQQFRDTELTIPRIAAQLNVGAVMEGSIQFAGDRVRVHAQLIDAQSDEHLWAQSYERELVDILDIESDIAKRIATALSTEFSLARVESPGSGAAGTLEAGHHLSTRPSRMDNKQRLRQLGQAIEADPDFAMARVERASIYIRELRTPASAKTLMGEESNIEALALADINAALAADPDLGSAHAWRGVIHQYNWRSAAARRAFNRGLDLSPNDADVLGNYAVFLSYSGHYEQAIEQAERALMIDPHNPEIRAALARFSMVSGDYERAQSVFESMGQASPWTVPLAAILEHIRGNSGEAEMKLRSFETYAQQSDSARWAALAAYAYARLELYDDAGRLLNRYRELARGQTVSAAASILAYLARGDETAALDQFVHAAADKPPYEAFDLLMDIATNVFRDPALDKPGFAAARENLMLDDPESA